MPWNKSEKGKKGSVAGKKSVANTRQLAYAILSGVGGLTKTEAKRRVGYDPRYIPEKTKAYQPIQQRIEAACDIVGVSVEANAATLGSIAYSPDNAAPERVSAIREINHMAGWLAPERVEVQQQTTSVVMLLDMIRGKGASIGELIRQAGQG